MDFIFSHFHHSNPPHLRPQHTSDNLLPNIYTETGRHADYFQANTFYQFT
jgi:hypothetical protein